jgi:hypothetical protein
MVGLGWGGGDGGCGYDSSLPPKLATSFIPTILTLLYLFLAYNRDKAMFRIVDMGFRIRNRQCFCFFPT